MKQLTALFLITFLAACSSQQEKEQPTAQSWNEIENKAKGTSLTMMMWQGDPLINTYMQDYAVPELKKRFGIDLNIVSGQGNQIIGTLMTEIEASKKSSEIDLMWINGETFYQLRQIDALYGPFVESLPNAQYIDWENKFISYDFQQPVEGYECPWGNVQLALIYNEEKVTDPPQSMADLKNWVKENPGKFTWSNDFTGMTLLKSWLNALAGEEQLSGEFDQAIYEKYSNELWAYVEELSPYLWNEGESFPTAVAPMHQLFANGEIWFTMSNNDSEVDNKILQGVFPESSRGYVPAFGTIQNSHYLGIVKHSANKEAAMMVCNFLISPEAQWKKMQPEVWGDATILAVNKLPAEWQKKFSEIPGRNKAPDRAEIQKRAYMEPAPEYMIKLFEDFRKRILNN